MCRLPSHAAASVVPHARRGIHLFRATPLGRDAISALVGARRAAATRFCTPHRCTRIRYDRIIGAVGWITATTLFWALWCTNECLRLLGAFRSERHHGVPCRPIDWHRNCPSGRCCRRFVCRQVPFVAAPSRVPATYAGRSVSPPASRLLATFQHLVMALLPPDFGRRWPCAAYTFQCPS